MLSQSKQQKIDTKHILSHNISSQMEHPQNKLMLLIRYQCINRIIQFFLITAFSKIMIQKNSRQAVELFEQKCQHYFSSNDKQAGFLKAFFPPNRHYFFKTLGTMNESSQLRLNQPSLSIENMLINDFFFSSSPQLPEPSEQPPKEDSPSSESHPTSSTKSKRIKKEQKSVSQASPNKNSKKISPKGRPRNEDLEKKHLQLNKSFNDIIFHYARLLIFLKIMQKNDSQPAILELTTQETAWLTKIETILETDNFPTFNEQNIIFLLQPNSLHFVFQHLKEQEGRRRYNSLQLKYMVFAFLKKKNILSTQIYHYLNDYWTDIMELVNDPDGEEEEQQEEEEQDDPKGSSELQLMKGELKNDDTIAAYELACYLHSCKQKFKLKFLPSHDII